MTLQNFDIDDFLKNYWQQCPVLIRGALPEAETLLSGDDLAGLATEPKVESRIISLDRASEKWSLKNGPFDDDIWSNLGEEDWTLLVQAVDHWDDDMESLRNAFSFLPSWRIDDIMVSFATKGGGVGPHFDQYDVFLIQGEGRREWKIGQLCNDESELIENLPVKVLSTFEEQESWVLEPGDMLYLPPALAHWGTSVENSITYSVGFRAPSKAEVMIDFGHFLSDHLNDFQRYSDAGIENRQSASSEIKESDIQRIQSIIREISNDKSLISNWLGQYMTEPKYDDTAVNSGDWNFDRFMEHWQSHALIKNSASRFAYYENRLLVDGNELEPCPALVSQIIDSSQAFEYSTVLATKDKHLPSVFCTLVNLGAFYFEEDI
ncbi:cupin domain-containing protein [Reinekea marina]|uniref:JmjC domain-containing protein n=1 Tax=Reinekea marina TaxID=1310421 RepID=A0ABV7WMH1_9GAMM|nr:cupin domain-containing protein [Reinekea marina]MDN3649425.1 cupin domain-containing protein [Reinekea marina]